MRNDLPENLFAPAKRALEVALSLVSFYDEFGDEEGWDEGLRYMISTLEEGSEK